MGSKYKVDDKKGCFTILSLHREPDPKGIQRYWGDFRCDCGEEYYRMLHSIKNDVEHCVKCTPKNVKKHVISEDIRKLAFSGRR